MRAPREHGEQRESRQGGVCFHDIPDLDDWD
jgi:rubredoxin